MSAREPDAASEHEPRYYVRQSFRDKPGTSAGRPALIAYVRDRWYCCADIASFASDDSRYAHLERSSRRFRVRTDAVRYCDALNAEHEANLLAPSL